VNVGAGPEDLPQFEDRFLYHLVDLAGEGPMGKLDGVPEQDVAARLAEELGEGLAGAERDAYRRSGARDVILATIEELEVEGMLTVPMKVTGPWKVRPTSAGRRQVAAWREQWAQNSRRQESEVQRAILEELERQWRADPERYKLRSSIDVERFCEETGVPEDVYLANAFRLQEQGKVKTMAISEASPANGLMHITEGGRRALETSRTAQRPQRDAQEAWVEVARLRRRLQVAERSLPSLIVDDELRRRCEDLLAADSHYDRVVREACVILENRVRRATEAEKSLVGTSLMHQAFSPKGGTLRLSEVDSEQTGAMNVYSGVMAFFRNAAGHNVLDSYTQEDALRFVAFVDLLLGMVAEALEGKDSGAGLGDGQPER
jgi:uncharacterized protein (TIGR02391 family)